MISHDVGEKGKKVLAVLILVCVSVIFLTLAWRFNLWRYRRSHALLYDWANKNGFRITDLERRRIATPLFWFPSDAQTVYRIAVVDQEGIKLRGWARCGGRFLGPLSNEVEVRWD
jgi:hypothetical protein